MLICMLLQIHLNQNIINQCRPEWAKNKLIANTVTSSGLSLQSRNYIKKQKHYRAKQVWKNREASLKITMLKLAYQCSWGFVPWWNCMMFLTLGLINWAWMKTERCLLSQSYKKKRKQLKIEGEIIIIKLFLSKQPVSSLSINHQGPIYFQLE